MERNYENSRSLTLFIDFFIVVISKVVYVVLVAIDVVVVVVVVVVDAVAEKSIKCIKKGYQVIDMLHYPFPLNKSFIYIFKN